MLRNQYKVDKWGKGYIYYSAYYKPWWWPFWIRCYNDIYCMCRTSGEAEEQANQHALKIPQEGSKFKYLGKLP